MDIELKEKLTAFATELRAHTLISVNSIGVGHVGGTMSIAELLAVLYGDIMHVDPQNPLLPERDKLVLSKGHAGPILYSALALQGFFPKEELRTLNKNGTRLPSHADRQKTPGIDMTTGSLGQGSSTAVGLALADRISGRDCTVYLVLGDGECNEGQVWEAAMFTAQHNLTNLITIVDYNKLQCDGSTAEVCDLGDLAAKYRAFGFEAIDVQNGNDIEQVYNAVHFAKTLKNKPCAIILNTVKGAGLSMYEGRCDKHHCAVSDEDLAKCLKELDYTV